MTDKMIVLADLGRVKAYRLSYETGEKPRIEMVYDCEFPDAHGRLLDKLTDQAGRFTDSGTSGTSTRENHNLRDEIERRLVRLVAQTVNDLARNQRYWFLAATQEINARILDLLPASARATLLRNVVADLVKIPKQQVMEYFLVSAS